MPHSLRAQLEDAIRSIPDYPHEGIIFRDITTLLGDAAAFRRSVDELVHTYAGAGITHVAGIEARGFILGGAHGPPAFMWLYSGSQERKTAA